ncbi:MAG: hypothetical protein ACLQG3_14675 [Terracidiphilus sp.]
MAKGLKKTMREARPDFAAIRLSDAGKRMAGDHGVIRWANGRRHFAFKAGETQEVERSFEWNHLLRHEMFEDQPIFEEVPEGEAQLPMAVHPPADVEPEKGE